MIKRLSVVILLAALSSARADEVKLKNGDQLTGTVVSLSGGKLKIDTEHSGSVSVAWDQIVHLKTEKPIRVLVASGEEHEGTLMREEGGALRVQVEGVEEPVELAPGDVTHFNKPSAQWRGDFTASAKSTDGNTHNTTFLFTGELSRKSDVNKILAKGAFQYADVSGTVTERSAYVQGKYDHTISGDLYGYVSEEAFSDRFKNLRVRSITSAGAGYQFLKEPWIEFSGELGAAYIYNNFRVEIPEEDDGYLGGRASATLVMRLPFGIEVKDVFTYYPNFDDTADWQIRNEAEASMGLGSLWGGVLSLKGGVISDIDNEPPPGNEEYDNLYYVGLGFKF